MRQVPETDKGVIFFALEDEIGSVNFIVWRHIRKRQSLALLHSPQAGDRSMGLLSFIATQETARPDLGPHARALANDCARCRRPCPPPRREWPRRGKVDRHVGAPPA
jgi:hypothetical protein